MRRLLRVDKLDRPVELGRAYLVPAVLWCWNQGEPNLEDGGMWWPVIGELHDDVEFFSFKNKHYHVDPRFLNRRHWRILDHDMHHVLGSPLNHRDHGPRPPVLRRMRCTQSDVGFDAAILDNYRPHAKVAATKVNKLRCAFAGVQCKRDRQGWVCPHRLAPLGSIAPVDGVITCFLHGLRIDAASGVCLPGDPSHQGTRGTKAGGQ